MKRTISYLLIGALLSLVISFFPVLSQAEEPIEIKAATWHPMKHRLTDDAFKVYGQEVEKRTNGKVKFKWFLAASLVPAGQTYPALTSGLVDAVVPLAAWAFEQQFPITRGVALPFVADSSSHASVIMYNMYQTIPEMKREYADVKLLGFFSTAISNIAMKGAPAKTIEEMKGLRIASSMGSALDLLKLLGASAQSIKLEDIYMSLQKGIAEGVIFPDAPLRSYKFIELLSNHTMGQFMVSPQPLAMNLTKWNSLPPDVQKVFEDLTVPAGCLAAATLDNEAHWVIEELKKRGDKFYYLTPEEKTKWKEKLKPMYDSWIAELNSKGMNGQAIFDKMMALSEEARKNTCKEETWWGRAGKKD